MKNKLFFTFLLFIGISFHSLGQQRDILPTKGKEFWIAFLQNYNSSSNDTLKIFISSDRNTFGTINIPLQGYFQTFIVNANQTTQIIIPNNIAEHYLSDVIDSKGIFLNTDDTVSVFALNFDIYTSDASKILPIQSLGTEYLITSYSSVSGNSEFAIVATEDQTEIEITPSAALMGGRPANVPYRITLNRGQSYQAKASATSADLTSTLIVATEASGPCRPFAVFSGSGCSNIPSSCVACDHIYEQEFPKKSWGKNYYITPFSFATRYAYRIIADENGTLVTINGAAPILLNSGQTHTQYSVAAAVCVSSNKRIGVTQFMEGVGCAGAGDPSMLFLNPEEQKIDAVTFSTVNSSVITSHNVNVIIETAFTSQLSLDGAPVNPASFTMFPSCPTYSYIQLPLTQGSHTLAADSGLTAYVYGTGQAESYAYSVGSFTKRPPIIADTVYCTSAQVTLTAPKPLFNAYWTLLTNPNDTIGYGQSITFTPVTSQVYVVRGDALISGCVSEFRFSVEVPTPPIVDITQSTISICQYGKVYLNANVTPASPTYQYSWTPTIDLDNPSIANPVATPGVSRWYYCRVSTPSGCGYQVDSVYIDVLSIGNISNTKILSATNKICIGESLQLNSQVEKIISKDEFNPGTNGAFWSAISLGAATADCGSVTGNALYFNGAGVRSATTVNFNVAAGGSVRFALKISNGVAPCENADLGENVVLEYSTNGGTTWTIINTYLENAYPTFKNVVAAIPAAAQTASTRFRWRQLANSGIGQDNWAIDNVIIGVNDNSEITFNWSPPAGLSSTIISNPVASPSTTTTYTLITTDNLTSCSYKDSILIDVGQLFTLNTSNDTMLCTRTGVRISSIPTTGTGYTYSWTPVATLSNPTIYNPIATPVATTYYYVTVTSPQGCIKKDSVLVTVNNPIKAFDATANQPAICLGSTSQLNLGETMINDDFDPSIDISQWSVNNGGVTTTSCGSVSGRALYFTNSGTRAITTTSQNYVPGGSINFYIKIANGTAPCDNADPGEDVVLEYSTNGITWTNIATFNEALYPFFTYFSIPIPAAAQTATTQFRWRQLLHSGAGQDNWSLDNVMIVRNLTGSHSYSWTPTPTLSDPAISNPVATPITTTTYHVAVQNLLTSCTYADDITVTVVPDFSIAITNDTILCSKAAGVQLTANASPGTGYFYNWTPTTGLSNPNIFNPVASPSVTTTYTVSVSLSGQCVKTETVTVTVNNPINKLALSANPPVICLGSSSQLNSGDMLLSESFDPMVNTQWTFSSGSMSNSCGSVSGNALYFNNVGSRYIQSVNQNVLSGATINFYLKIGSGAAPCDNADPGEDIVLEYSINGGSTWFNIATYNEAEYPYFRFISATIPAGAQTTATQFRWRQLTNSGIDQDNWAIDNIKIIKTLTGPFTYTWTPATGLSNTSIFNPVATPVATTTYHLSLVNTVTGCSYEDSIPVIVVPDFTLTASNDTTLCSRGPGVQLTANASPGSGYTYFWTPAASLSDPNIFNPVARPSTTTTYTVNAVVAGGGCLKSENVTITANNPINLLQATASPTTLLCLGHSSQMNVGDVLLSENFDPIINTQWSSIRGTVSNSCGSVSGNALYFTGVGLRFVQTFAHNVIGGGNISFYLKIGSGAAPCDDAETGEDIVLEYSTNGGVTWGVVSTFNEALYPNFTYINVPLPSAAITTATIFRWRQLSHSGLDQDNWAIDNVEITRGFTGSYNFTWTPAAGLSNTAISNPVATPASTTTYYVTASNTITNCIYQDSIMVTVVPSFILDAGRDTTICKNNSVAFNAIVNPAGTYTYQWIPATGLSATNIPNPTAMPAVTTKYKVYVTSDAGCIKQDSLTVNISGEAPLVNLSASKTTVCKGETIQLNALTGSPCGLNAASCFGSLHTSTVGTGTSSSEYPFSGYYSDSKTQLLFTQAELIAAGVVAGESIRSIAFNVVTKSSTMPFDFFTIKMACTSLTQLTSSTFVTVPNVVYTSKPVTTFVGWNTLNFDTPYSWDGSSNLIIELCFDNTSWNWSQDYVSSTFTTGNYTLGYYTDGASGCAFTTGNLSTNRPNIRFNSCSSINSSYTYSWSPTTGLSNPNNQSTNAIVNATTTYTLTTTSGSCSSVRSVLVSLDASNTVDATFDTTCTNGQPIPLHAIVTGSPVNATLSCGAGTTPVTAPSIYTVGNGTSITSNVGPFYGGYSDGKMQYLITASELTAAGMSMGTITRLGFNVTNKFSSVPYSNFTVKVGCTSATFLNIASSWEPATTVVYGPVNYSTILGLNTLIFSTPYNWNGSSNLVVEICYDNSSSTSSDFVSYSNTTYASTMLNISSFTSGCSLAPSFSSSLRPNMTFTICPPAPGTFTYNWTPTTGLSNSTIANPIANASTNTWYKVTLNGGRCPVSDSVYLQPNQQPIVTISPSTCVPDSVQLVATGGITYAWTPSIGLSNPTIANPKADPAVTTEYFVTVTNSLGCQKTDSLTVYRGAINPALSPDTSLCKGDSIQLFASGAPLYSWSPSAGLNNATIANPMVSPTATTTYTVTYSTPDGICFDTKSVTVVVYNKPELVLTPDTYLCVGGDSIQLNVSGAATYNWTPVASLNNPTISNPKALPAVATVYKVIGTSTDGCENIDSVEVVIKNLPVITITPDTSICEGENITLKANDGIPSFVPPVWTPGNLTGSSVTVSPAVTTKYHVVLGDQFCMNEDSVEVVVFNNPVIVVSNDTTICKGGIAQLNASGGLTYIWSPVTALNDPAIANPQADPAATTRYYVLADNADGCTSVDSIDVTVIDHYIVEASANPFPVACEGDTVQLAATGGVSYTWVPTTNMNNPAIANPYVILYDTTTFTVYSSNICFTDSAKVTINVKPYPVAKAYKDTTLCFGDFTQLRADTSSTYTYSWTPITGLSDPAIYNPLATPLTTTEYILEVSNGFCISDDTVTVTVMPQLIANIQPNKIEGVSPLTVNFANYSSGGTSYLWVFGDGDSSLVEDPTHIYETPGIYKVLVYIYNSEGCFEVDSFFVTSVDFIIPNLITPNGDGHNDRFQLSSLGDQWNVEIYNRWGELVFKKDGYSNDWAGEGCPDGIYYFSIKDTEFNKDYSGWVQVVK